MICEWHRLKFNRLSFDMVYFRSNSEREFIHDADIAKFAAKTLTHTHFGQFVKLTHNYITIFQFNIYKLRTLFPTIQWSGPYY